MDSFSSLDPAFRQLTIRSGIYSKFTVGPGKIPMLCIDAWENIWKMPEDDLGGKRSYIADFEIYDERSKNYSNTTLDIYIGIKQ